MNQIAYHLLHAVCRTVARLPFRALYAISDAAFVLVYHVVGYRRRVVRSNLSSSFPEKTTDELRAIEKRFYHWLCDYFLETLKMLDMTPRQMLEHIEFRGAEAMEKCFDEGQSCAAILGHYCNWEYLSAAPLPFRRHPEAKVGLIYHPLYNKAFDRLFIDIRSSMGGMCVRKQDILRQVYTLKQQGVPSLFGYISDQAPKWENIHLWLPFLNHDTPVFTNGERIMRKMNNAVFYVDMQRPERGRYVCTYRLIAKTPGELPEHGVTRRFFEMLEDTIRRQPEYYLWTHNRWKRTHEEYNRKVAAGEIKVKAS